VKGRWSRGGGWGRLTGDEGLREERRGRRRERKEE